MRNTLPSEGFVRLSQLIGSKDVPGPLPISRSTLWLWVRQGKFPPGIKLSERVRVWPVKEVREILAAASEGNNHESDR